jgi:hypothetical protein
MHHALSGLHFRMSAFDKIERLPRVLLRLIADRQQSATSDVRCSFLKRVPSYRVQSCCHPDLEGGPIALLDRNSHYQ